MGGGRIVNAPRVAGKVLLVVGLGRSGCAAGALLRRHGARVLGGDDAPEEAVQDRWERDGLASCAAVAFDEVLAQGAWRRIAPARLNAVVLSPGVPPDNPGIMRLRASGLPVHGELEWSSRFFEGRSVAVTGTNGKSTTTAWIAHVLQGAGLNSPALGNLGKPLADVVDSLPGDAVPVIECSSFQLETIENFRPHVGLLLNLAPDHLDRYDDLDSYYHAKLRLARQVVSDGTFVTWTGCAPALASPHGGVRVLYGDPADGASVWVHDGMIRAVHGTSTQDVLPVCELGLSSPANRLNALAVTAAVMPLVRDVELVGEGLRSFGGLEHRHQFIGRLGDIRFVDDSKGTNVHAVCAGLRDYPTPVVLIVGGSGKGEDYTPLRHVMSAVRHVVTIGQEGPAIGEALAGRVPVTAAGDLRSAVGLAARLAAPDATVLLSPACASFDMFSNYHERGQAFAAAARALGARRN
jgi:UDP-N-acetylmuramoylalanine--D-glutamate ligase